MLSERSPSAGEDDSLYERLTNEGLWTDETVVGRLRENVMRRPEAIAFFAPDGVWTWRAYSDCVGRLAAGLQELGLRRGDRLVMALPDSVVGHSLEDASGVLGVVAVRINVGLSGPEILRLLRRVEPSAFVTWDQWHGRDYASEGMKWAEALDARCHQIVVGDRQPPGATSLADLMQPAPLEIRPAHNASDPYLMTLTSGTEGDPKIVMHHSLRSMFYGRYIAEQCRASNLDVMLASVSHSSGMGVWAAHALPTYCGATSVTLDRFDVHGVLEAMERFGVTILFVVPTQLIKLLDHPALRDFDLSRLRVVLSAGAHLPASRAEEAERMLGCRLITASGASDSGATVASDIDDSPERRWGSWGRLPPGTEVRFSAEEGGPVVMPHGKGYLATRGGYWCPGYYRGPNAASEKAEEAPPGWQITGDIWEADQDGYYRIAERRKDVIIRAGQNISTREVEEAIAAHPEVSQVAVIAEPHPVLGERVCAVIVAKAGHTIELEDVVTFLDLRGLSKYKHPERVVLVDELPQSATGKVLKSSLVDMFNRGTLDND